MGLTTRGSPSPPIHWEWGEGGCTSRMNQYGSKNTSRINPYCLKKLSPMMGGCSPFLITSRGMLI